ncbi:MAG TPA: hypothetical protein PLQ78_06280 [Flavipsychrobacter sp.]|jgi:hypothetical protein|nr:hypothetical protein [Flavipsychrobacter sp.]
MLTIRVFRAIDDLTSCEKFAEGHANVLKDYGVTKVTSARTDWFHNPGVYVVLVIDNETGLVVGGERIHLVSPGFYLPIQEAVAIVEPKVHTLVEHYANNKITGEICGLWNSKSIAGKGVSMFLTKMGVAIARQIGMDSLFVLCAPYTVKMCQDSGFEIETSIGNEGRFVYPKLDLIATALVVKDLHNISPQSQFYEEIIDFYDKPISQATVLGEKGETIVQYNITLTSASKPVK